jgi:hypothetical protein
VVELRAAGCLEQLGDGCRVLFDYVDKPGCQSCGLAEWDVPLRIVSPAANVRLMI